nr:SDR family NAD(P)-dependent oxidoreductase [uncultured Pedobacter sp.]
MRNKSVKKIAIIGCGWLGLPLAKKLLKDEYSINGSTTSVHKLGVLEQNGIVPYLIQLGTADTINGIKDFLAVDLLIINIPPGRHDGSGELYLAKLQYLRNEILLSSVKKVIFISSTSVYSENNGIHTEESNSFGDTATAKRMLAAENIFSSLNNRATTIIRMAGLIGPDRHPGRFFASKSDIPNGLAPMNLIHLDDCIGVISKVIEDDLWNEIFNGATPSHPTKMEFYDMATMNLYGKHADFIAEKKDFKIIDANKIISKGYQFKYPDLMEWLKAAPQN